MPSNTKQLCGNSFLGQFSFRVHAAATSNRSHDDLLLWFKNGHDLAVRPNVTG